ncbi:AAA family ATPase [Pseudomonas sp. 3A(2025)]
MRAIWSGAIKDYHYGHEGGGLKTDRLNLLIGPNNSGKSRLLRSIFYSDIQQRKFALKSRFDKLSNGFYDVFEILSRNPVVGGFDSGGFFDLISGECVSIEGMLEACEGFSKLINDATRPNYSMSGTGAGVVAFRELQHLLIAYRERNALNDFITDLKEEVDFLARIKSFYVPVLRGLRPLNDQGDFFYERTVKDYFPKLKDERELKQGGGIKSLKFLDHINVVTGFHLYSLLVSHLLGQPEDRARIREYEEVLGREFFGGAVVTLIPSYGKDTISVKIGDEDQFPIYDLGDGMQQVIIITSEAFLNKEKSLFFIEEPEACLHPGLLRKLAAFLLEYTNHYYFATTHSNHLLDLAEVDNRVVIHKVSKRGVQKDLVFSIQECTRDKDILAELGVLASSVYLVNSTIWVEGVTDRLYLGVFLKKYLEELLCDKTRLKLEGYLENNHYAFVEYQGGTLGHWSFENNCEDGNLNAKSLCSSAFLIADGDIVGKGSRAKILEEQLGMRLHILVGKEIENFIPRDILLAAALNIFSRKKKSSVDGLDSDLLKNFPSNIESSEQGVGFHLDVALGLKGKGKDNRRIFADESGTIKDKVKFCHEVVDVMTVMDWHLTDSLRDLCSKIFDHVMVCNSR